MFFPLLSGTPNGLSQNPLREGIKDESSEADTSFFDSLKGGLFCHKKLFGTISNGDLSLMK
jgi:hypothetical protein